MAITSGVISVGVIIPVFNRPEGVIAAINSVLDQTFQPAQIIVVDDCSASTLTLPAHLHADPCLTLVRLNQNSGASAARKAGIEQLQTTHVAFLDSDDVWAPNKLMKQVQFLESLGSSEMTAVSCGWQWTDSHEASQTRHPRASADISDFVGGCWFCPGSTVLISLAALNRIGSFDPALRRLEDLDLFIRFAKAGGRLEVVPSVAATICRGRNASRKEVDQAAARLREKYSESGEEPLPPDLRRRLNAWLAVEEAAAARNEREFFRVASRLAYSLLIAPRLGVQLENWWR